jgi:2-phosphosulfolactate phosphatase
MCTTNGTRAIVAARQSAHMLTGALVNASAVAAHARRVGLDVTLLCAGTNGAVAMEDAIGAGAILDALRRDGPIQTVSDVARLALRVFDASRDDLRAALRDAQGGRNVVAAGLESDIVFAAALDHIPVVGVVDRAGLTVTRLTASAV